MLADKWILGPGEMEMVVRLGKGREGERGRRERGKRPGERRGGVPPLEPRAQLGSSC